MVAVLAVFAVCGACTVDRTYRCSSYIQGYYAIDSLTATLSEVQSGGVCYDEVDIRVSACHPLGSYLDSGGEFARYSGLHNDNAHKMYEDFGAYIWYPGDDISSVRVRCTGEWDEDHPSGSDLADISIFAGLTVRPYIDGGYVPCEYGPDADYPLLECVFPEMREWKTQPWYPVCKSLRDIHPEDMSLVGGRGDVRPLFSIFIPVGRNDGFCSLELKVTDVSGKTFSLEIPPAADVGD